MSGDATLAGVPVSGRVTLAAPRLDAARTRRLAELGLRAGAEVVVLHRTAGGGRVIAIGDARIALDRATLRAMFVRTAEVPA
jgi:ferrous iron transport protein A